MRNFEQRKAEVLRRSEERIKEKKRKIKTNIAVIVTPIVLCAFFAGAYFNVVMAPAHEQSDASGAMREEIDNSSADRRYPEGTEAVVDDKGEEEKSDSFETGNKNDGAIGETAIPLDTEINVPADTNVPASTSEADTEKPSDTGIRCVQLATYVPNGLATVTRDATKIKIATKLIHSYTNGEATIEGFDRNTVAHNPQAKVPDSIFTIVMSDNFGLDWRYEITKDSIVFPTNEKSYPITEEEFNILVDELDVYLP